MLAKRKTEIHNYHKLNNRQQKNLPFFKVIISTDSTPRLPQSAIGTLEDVTRALSGGIRIWSWME